jgi:hypothetical protein
MLLGSLLWRGMLAGLCAGILAFGFASVAGEPHVNTSISFEEQQARAQGEPSVPPLVPREVQSTAGLFTGVALYGVAFGGLFALAFAAAFGRVRRASPSRTALWLAAGVFGAVVLVPSLKYPANPPAVGDPGTIGARAALYFAMVAVSICAAIGAVWLSTRLLPRWGAMRATLAAAGAYLAVVVAVGLALPGSNEVPATFPAATLWNFRVASLGVQAVTWTTIGLLFAYFAERVMRAGGGGRTPG